MYWLLPGENGDREQSPSLLLALLCHNTGAFKNIYINWKMFSTNKNMKYMLVNTIYEGFFKFCIIWIGD